VVQVAARVLLAEDDQGIRALVGSVLHRAGLTVEFAADGKEAIECLQENSYDAILLDLMMPTASGFEVLAWMHKEKRGAAKQCVIILTAMPEKELAHLTKERVFAVIRKPFDIDELMETVKRCIDARKS
jgi:CheY-like chemotaxis protein